MKPRWFGLFVCALILVSSPFMTAAEEILLPEEESPRTVFDSLAEDGSDVDFFLTGSWGFSLTGGLGLSWMKGGSGVSRASFPGMDEGFIFRQFPDLTVSLWLRDRYFFEASFIDDYELNTILFGYEGKEEEFLRQVRIGNTEIGFGRYGFLSLPEASTDSLGGMALFQGSRSEHQAALRYDSAEKQQKSFVGYNEVDVVRFEATDYVTGQFFILPDSGVENLKVYVEDAAGLLPDGEGRRYREADSSEAAVSASRGLVFFRKPLNRRAAVTYEGIPANFDNLLYDDFFLPELLGRESIEFFESAETTYFIIHTPGKFSPFEHLGIYRPGISLPGDPSLSRLLLTPRNIAAGERLSFTPFVFDAADEESGFGELTEKGLIRILGTDGGLRSPESRYPLAAPAENFSSLDPDMIYGPGRLIDGDPPDRDLTIEVLRPVSALRLDSGVLEGSVEIRVNGVPERRFTFDPGSGVLTLLMPVGPSDRIDVYYRTRSAGAQGGDFIAGIGNRFTLSPTLSAELGAGIRWNITEGVYTTRMEESTGSILLTGGVQYWTDRLTASFSGGISFSTPDTTGYLRLMDMEDPGFIVPVSRKSLYPSAPPVSGPAETFPLFHEDRGVLRYRDYHSYGFAGVPVLQHYSWTGFASYPYADYTAGGKIGPYVAATGDLSRGDAIVFEYELEYDQWAGGMVPLVRGSRPLDLSNARAIRFLARYEGENPPVDFHIRIGRLGEDLDGDGILDEETSIYSRGFSFSAPDPENVSDITFLIGGGLPGEPGNGILDTEDLDGNKILDPEDPGLTVSRNFTINGTDTMWKEIVLPLGPDMREKLRAVTALEIIIHNTNTPGEKKTGRLMISEISLPGAGFTGKSDANGTLTVYSAPDDKLLKSFPEVRDRFHASGVTSQGITRFEWSNPSVGSAEWQATGFTEPADLGAYKKLSFYMKIEPPVMPDLITFSYLNPEDLGVTIGFDPDLVPGSTSWKKYTVDLDSKKLYADGSGVPGSLVDITDRNARGMNTVRIVVDVPDVLPDESKGAVLLDEVHLHEPVFGIGGAVETYLRYSYPEPILRTGDRTVLGNFVFENSSRFSGGDFSGSFGSEPGSVQALSSSALSFNLFKTGISADLTLLKTGQDLVPSGGYSITAPFFRNRIRLEDTYRESFSGGDLSLSRKNRIGYTEAPFAAAASGEVLRDGNSFVQRWMLSGAYIRSMGFSAKASADWSLTADPEKTNRFFDPNFTSLPERWVSSYAFFLPSRDDAESARRSVYQAAPAWRNEMIGIEIIEDLSTTASGKTGDREQSVHHTLTLRLPLSPGGTGTGRFTITPGYKRMLKYSAPMDAWENRQERFLDDLVRTSAVLTEQSYIWLAPPFAEFAGFSALEQFGEQSEAASRVSYSPEAFVDFRRPFGSRVSDLFVPSQVKVSTGRTMIRDFDTLTDRLNFRAEAGFTGINLFGRLGRRPVFPWYRTDEFSHSISFRAAVPQPWGSIDPGGEDTQPLYSVSASQYVNLILREHRNIVLENRTTISWPGTGGNGSASAAYQWRIIPENPVRLPFIPGSVFDAGAGSGAIRTEQESYLSNRESVGITYRFDSSRGESLFSGTAKHSTELIIPGTARFSSWLSFGIERKSFVQADNSVVYYASGIQAGLEGRISF